MAHATTGWMVEVPVYTRSQFREAVWARDNYMCVVCGSAAVDAHHIIERRLWADGGYYLDNGVSLCAEHHLAAEATTLTCEELREECGIQRVVLPHHLYVDTRYDKWGNPYVADGSGRRYRGELYYDKSVQRALGDIYDDPRYFVQYVKYPRTYHLPWSPGGTSDDRKLSDDDANALLDDRLVVTVKLDGENCNMYRDKIHARSLDTKGGDERDWVKNLHASIAHDIPPGWRICGENLWAQHAVAYSGLGLSFFRVFSIWDETNRCLSWDGTVEWCELFGLEPVPVLYKGLWRGPEATLGYLRACQSPLPDPEHEGYVVRRAAAFDMRHFRTSVAKYVREGHVPEHGRHWKRGQLKPNNL